MIGSQREIIQMLAYEPVLVLMVVGVYLVTGSFLVARVYTTPLPLLYHLPLVFLALLLVITIKLRKSPFDLSTSHHAHQELVKGITTEYAGPMLALIELGHWYELIFLLLLLSMFWAPNLWVGAVLALGAFLLEIGVDNLSARLTLRWMLAASWLGGIGLALVNIAWLYLK